MKKVAIIALIIASLNIIGCGCDPVADITGVEDTENRNINASNNSGTILIGDGTTVNYTVNGENLTAREKAISTIYQTNSSNGKYGIQDFQFELKRDSSWEGIHYHLYILNNTDEYHEVSVTYDGDRYDTIHESISAYGSSYGTVKPNKDNCIDIISLYH